MTVFSFEHCDHDLAVGLCAEAIALARQVGELPALGQDELDRLRAEGAQLSLDAAVELALTPE